MASRWLLDTSALLALRDNEAGAERAAAQGLLVVILTVSPRTLSIPSA